MRILLLFVAVLGFASCKDDKYTSVPQIEFLRFSPNAVRSDQLRQDAQPRAIIEVRDAEGDISRSDSAKVYLKNIISGREDSTNFPDLPNGGGSDLKAEVEIGLFSVIAPITSLPGTDTLQFEIYIRDEKGQKSNVVLASPFYYIKP